jgi:DNA-directed RNA polymerase beta subunit
MIILDEFIKKHLENEHIIYEKFVEEQLIKGKIKYNNITTKYETDSITYFADIIEFEEIGDKITIISERKNERVISFPILSRSLNYSSDKDSGGYFIINGSEKL